MAYEVKLPDIGEGVAEGEIVRWLVKPGERVREDQPLVEVMTDKASVEIPSPRSGVIAALHAEEGQVVNVGVTIISIDVDGEAPAAVGGAPAAHRAAPAAVSGSAPTVAATKTAAPRVQATPAVRQLAKQLGVSLESIRGTGREGAISADDVKRAAANGATPVAAGGATPAAGGAAPTAGGAKPAAGGARPATAAPGGTGPAAPAPTTSASASAGPEERVPLKGLRRKIAEHMRRSIATAAHFTFVAECDMTELAAHRASLDVRTKLQDVKLTYLAYVVKALVASLRQFPMLNATLDDAKSEIVIKRYYHVGIATHTPEGLTVPVIRDADRLTLFAVAREIDRLAQAARAGKLKLEELQGATITVTSTGAKGGVLATPILHHPQVAILGVHEVRKRPAVVNDEIVIRNLGNLSLSLDHRVVDGAVGAEFLYDLIHRLETPAAWLNEKEIG
jgi:pyruvate dehydrogenase E2 component (dihydrolipoyllysine-residue acetyltransferase)